MTGDHSVSAVGFSCDEVAELAGLYVLGALERDEELMVTEHLSTCPELHDEFAELGSVVPALPMLAEPIAVPPDLKARVMDAYRRDMSAAVAPAGATATATAEPATRAWEIDAPARRGSALPQWLGWAAAAAAVLVLAVVGVWALGIQQRADSETQRAETMAAALKVLAQPGSSFAVLEGQGAASGVGGFVAFSPEGEGYMVMTNVPEAPAGMTYQAWYVVDGQPASAGTMSADADGFVIAEGLPAMEGTDVMAITLEPAGGSAEPTSDPIVVGEMVTRA